MAELGSAAFVRVEGVLLGRPTLATAAWLAANAQRVRERFARLGATALALPFALGADKGAANRLGWAALRGVSEDRIAVLGEEYAEQYLLENLRETGLELVSQARRRHDRLVLVSDNIGPVVQRVADQISADELLCNQLEFNASGATGRLREPRVSSHLSGQGLRSYAATHGIDLARSAAYGSSAADSLLLSAVGLPCAAHPDRALRRVARDYDWPIVEAR
ncbi:MAG: haloacid dehalogenase-like hydrolase [Proteobacteria bacterium]|nr:haloacid dehalogenase-like hydrolase [Pseudomonadota bacterium]